LYSLYDKSQKDQNRRMKAIATENANLKKQLAASMKYQSEDEDEEPCQMATGSCASKPAMSTEVQ